MMTRGRPYSVPRVKPDKRAAQIRSSIPHHEHVCMCMSVKSSNVYAKKYILYITQDLHFPCLLPSNNLIIQTIIQIKNKNSKNHFIKLNEIIQYYST